MVVEERNELNVFQPFYLNVNQLKLTHEAYYETIGRLKNVRVESEEERKKVRAKINTYRRLDNKIVRLLFKLEFGEESESEKL